MAKTSAKKSENKAKKGTQTNMWTGRFASGMAQSMVDLSFSLQFDAELIEEDIEGSIGHGKGSIGHGKGLVESGVLSKADYKKICDGLASILKDYKAGKNLWQESDEDIHMAVERVLTERIGALGKKIHTGRSRVAVTTRSARTSSFTCATAPLKSAPSKFLSWKRFSTSPRNTSAR